MALRLRRGTNAERLTVTPESGEIIYVTDTKKLFVGDGSTVGGNLVSGVNDIIDDVTPQLGGDLDLNNNNIIGNGNINITGTITATGNINLGDGAGGDVISVGGEVSGSLVPTTDESFVLGSASKRWTAIWSSGLTVSGNATAESFTGDIVSDDSTVVFDSSTNTFTGTSFTGNVIGNVTGNVTGNTVGYHTGDVTGSVFADDSTLMVDAISNIVSASIANFTDTNTTTLNVTDAINGVSAKLVGSNTHATLELKNNNGAGVLGDQVSLGRVLFGEDITGNIHWTIDSTKDYLNLFPNPTGTPDYTTFAQVWKNGKFQIGGEAGGSGFQGMVREPVATLEVYGDAQIQTDLTVIESATVGHITISANNITTTDSNTNIVLRPSGTGTVELDIPTQTTVGAAGAASALPATPSTYFKINVGGTEYVVPAYAVS